MRAYRIYRDFDGAPVMYSVEIVRETADQVRLAERILAFGCKLLWGRNEIDTTASAALTRALNDSTDEVCVLEAKLSALRSYQTRLREMRAGAVQNDTSEKEPRR